MPQLRDDLKAGWLEKRSGDSSNLNALPVDSWKWQRRWFVLAMESGFLYYFKSPEQMSTLLEDARSEEAIHRLANWEPWAGDISDPNHSTEKALNGLGTAL